jgi:hypothetical protein
MYSMRTATLMAHTSPNLLPEGRTGTINVTPQLGTALHGRDCTRLPEIHSA